MPSTTPSEDESEDDLGGMTCYKGGETVFNNHQFCDVTSEFTYHILLPTLTNTCRPKNLGHAS